MITISWYESNSGKTEARDKYLKGNYNLKAEFDAAVLYLSVQPRKNWKRPKSAKLKKCKNDFYEIRLFANEVQERPIGFWFSQSEFVILLWAVEKDDKLYPKNWCLKASNRRQEIIDGNATKRSILNDIIN